MAMSQDCCDAVVDTAAADTAEVTAAQRVHNEKKDISCAQHKKRERSLRSLADAEIAELAADAEIAELDWKFGIG